MPNLVNFIELLADVAREHGLLLPVNIKQTHPIINQILSICLINNQDSVGNRGNIFQVQNAAASDVDATWIPDYH
jgi:hypothetical protein